MSKLLSDDSSNYASLRTKPMPSTKSGPSRRKLNKSVHEEMARSLIAVPPPSSTNSEDVEPIVVEEQVHPMRLFQSFIESFVKNGPKQEPIPKETATPSLVPTTL